MNESDKPSKQEANAESNKDLNRAAGAGAKRSFIATMKAVMWSFVGLRRKSDYDVDDQGMNPAYVIIAALIGTALFIGVLVLIVKLVVPK